MSCLCCKKPFKQKSKFHRICGPCSKRRAKLLTGSLPVYNVSGLRYLFTDIEALKPANI